MRQELIIGGGNSTTLQLSIQPSNCSNFAKYGSNQIDTARHTSFPPTSLQKQKWAAWLLIRAYSIIHNKLLIKTFMVYVVFLNQEWPTTTMSRVRGQSTSTVNWE